MHTPHHSPASPLASTRIHPAASSGGVVGPLGHAPADHVAIGRPLLTTRRAAEYCGLAKNTLEKMRLYGRKDNNTPRFIKLNSAVRYHPDDLDVWIARNRAITTSEYDPSN